MDLSELPDPEKGVPAFEPPSKGRLALMGLGLLACIAVAVVLFFYLHSLGAFLPSWVRWDSGTVEIDLDGDGGLDSLSYGAKRLEVTDARGRSCATQEDWLVASCGVGDIDGDGGPEIVMLAWRRGSFGSSRPSWVEEDTDELTLHIYIVRYADGALEPLWMSSAVPDELVHVRVDAQGHVWFTGSDEKEREWVWDEWGLSAAAGDAVNLASGEVTLLCVGDNIIHQGIYQAAWNEAAGAYDFTSVYAPVRARVTEASIAAVVQETPLVADRAQVSAEPYFGTPEAAGDALAACGFDVICSATNHALDKGGAGLAGTAAYWHEHHPELSVLGIREAGAAPFSPVVVERGGMRLALFNASFGTNGIEVEPDAAYAVELIGDGSELAAAVAAAEGVSDAQLCFLHVGEEYASEPSAEQRALEERLIDAGAEAVVCSHAHVVQPMEWVRTQAGNTGLVYHGLGNFVSNQEGAERALGAAASITFDRAGQGEQVRITRAQMLPLVCHMEAGATAVYWLDSYTSELASRHAFLSREGVGTDELWRLWEQVAG